MPEAWDLFNTLVWRQLYEMFSSVFEYIFGLTLVYNLFFWEKEILW